MDGWHTVEEVLAVVGNTPILHSDIELAALVNLDPRDPIETPEAYRKRLLESRIRLEIQFRDLEESGVLFRLSIEASRARAALVARAGGEEVLDAELRQHGLIEPDIDELALRVAAVDAYVEQRLRPRVTVTIEEIETAYQELLVNEIAASDDEVPPLVTVRDRLHELLIERKLNEEIERWLERAAARQEVTRYGG
jgi:hypothetical protein